MDRMDREAAALAALGSSARLEVFRLLARHAPHSVPAGKIAEALGRRPNTLSVQVAALVRAGLVEGRREGKSILYRVSAPRVAELLDWIAEDCCGGRPAFCGLAGTTPAAARLPLGGDAPVAAFLCSGAAARSALAAAMVNARGKGRLRAVQAGAQPGTHLPAEAQLLLREIGVSPADYAPADWRALEHDAPEPSYVFTLCDIAADEGCQFWSGRPYQSHWPLPDPSVIQDQGARLAGYRKLAAQIAAKVDALLALSPERLTAAQMQSELDRIGAA